MDSLCPPARLKLRAFAFRHLNFVDNTPAHKLLYNRGASISGHRLLALNSLVTMKPVEGASSWPRSLPYCGKRKEHPRSSISTRF